MALVTIEGSSTPSTYLPRGAKVTVERTGFIENLIRNGFVLVVKTPVVVDKAVESDPVFATDVPEPSSEDVPEEIDVKGAPARNGTEAEWRSWLDEAGIPFDPDDRRKQLIERWDVSNG